MSIATINLNALLKHAITSARNDETLTIEQIIANVLGGDKACVDLTTLSSDKSEKKPTKATKETKTRTRTAPPKPRAIPNDDIRCYARSFYEDRHNENGLLKIMRDDPENLYGDRCRFKKDGETDFCKQHGKKQTLGVWDGEYAGKFKTAVEKTENSDTAAPIAKKAPKPKATAEKPASPKSEEYINETEDESESESVDEAATETIDEKKKPASAPEVPSKQKPSGPKIEEPEVEVEDVIIDGVSYIINPSDGTVYDQETEDPVGKYNIKTKKWIVKPSA